jgi:hypothetical protein
MKKLNHIVLLIIAACCGAHGFDTTITFAGGRQYGTFRFDGRSNMASGTRTDVPDTVRLGSGFVLTRLKAKGGSCILGCSYPVQSGIVIQADSGSAGFRTDSNLDWNGSVSFPTQLTRLDSINPMTLSPCFGGGPYGLGFIVSSDDASSVGGGCADKSTFRSWPGYDRIVYFRKGPVFLKLQVAGFEIDSTDCRAGQPLYTCTRGDQVVFRYVITDDSTGSFGADLVSIRNPVKPVRSFPGPAVSAWKSDLYRLILGRQPVDGEKR